MKFREATKQDIQQIMYIIEQAKISLREQGIDQWQDGYPNVESILMDIENHVSYVIENQYQIVATGMISEEKDPYYAVITNGTWLQDKDYVVIHRIATHPRYKGKSIASLLFENAVLLFPQIFSLRVDTHDNNLSMQRLLQKNGFVYCGNVSIAKGAKRRAYEKIIID